MPKAILSGQSLANAIYAITDKLEAEFAAEFIAQMRKLSRRKSLQELLDQIEGGYYSSVATIPTSLLSLQIDTSKLNAIARKAMGSAARITDEKIGLNIGFNVRNPTIIEAARNISVDLSTNLSQTSQKILDKVIGDAMEGIVTRREAVKIIESRVGLLPTHSDAVDRYYDTLIQSGATKANAKKLADKYADRLLRYRANTIARTEIARATGIGQAEFWRQAVADGSLPPDAKRVWTTSYDERVCEICGPMNNVETGIFEQWLTPNGFVDYPSGIHPNCRCSQGIAMSAAQKRLFIGKTDGEQFEHYVLSKFNPNHDELGRFSSGGVRRVSQMPKSKAKSTKQKFFPDEKLINAIKNYTFGGGDFRIIKHYANLESQTSDKSLHRGMTFSEEDFEKFVGQIKVGKTFKAFGTSWSESKSVGKEFASDNAPSGSMGDYSVVMEIQSGAKGLYIAPWADEMWRYQKEWYVADSKYKVVGFSRRGKRAKILLKYLG